MTVGRELASLCVELFGVRQTDEARLVIHAEARARQLSMELSDYLLELPTDVEEQVALATVATNGWTWFWREVQGLEQACQRLSSRSRRVHAWVAGCSTGEEAFTLAMVAARAGLDMTILATDVDEARIRHARAARYEEHAMRHLPPPMVNVFFIEDRGRWRPVDALRDRIRFEVHNLLSPPKTAPIGDWDLVCCRNVMLHVDAPSARRMLVNLSSVLGPSGERLLSAADELAVDQVRIPPPVPAPARFPVETASSPVPLAYSQTSVHPPDSSEPLAITEASSPEMSSAAAIRAEDWGAAEALLKAQVERSPEDFDAWLTLGNLHAARHRLEEAGRAYEAAEALEPQSAELLLMRGLLHRKAERLDEAEAAIRRALFLEPDLWLGWMLLAGIYERAGLASRARRALETTLRGVTRRPRLTWRAPDCGMKDRRMDAATATRFCRARLGSAREGRAKRDGKLGFE